MVSLEQRSYVLEHHVWTERYNTYSLWNLPVITEEMALTIQLSCVLMQSGDAAVAANLRIRDLAAENSRTR